MATTAKVTSIGHSAGIILPKELLERLRISKGDILTVTETPVGGQAGLRDEGQLLSALARPQQLWCSGNPPPDLTALAASYAFGISKNHPFLDGGNRTGFVVCHLFLKWNGIELHADKVERYVKMLVLAAGEHDEAGFAAWLREATRPAG